MSVHEEAATAAVRLATIGPAAPWSRKVLASSTVSESAIKAMQEGTRQPWLAHVREWLPRMVRENYAAAVAVLELGLGLREAGLGLYRLVAASPVQGLALEVLDVGAAVGRLEAATSAALADRHFSSDDSARVMAACDDAQRQLAEVRALAAQAGYPRLPGLAA